MNIGVDTHKKTHVLVAVGAQGQTLGTRTVANTPAGWAVALQLGWLLGPRKAWHVWKIVRARGVALRLQRATSGGIARRVLLKTGLAGFAALTARFALPSGSAHACEPCGGGAYACGQYCALTSCTDFPCCCYSPGAGKDYSCYDNQTGELCSTHSDRCCFCSC